MSLPARKPRWASAQTSPFPTPRQKIILKQVQELGLCCPVSKARPSLRTCCHSEQASRCLECRKGAQSRKPEVGDERKRR